MNPSTDETRNLPPIYKDGITCAFIIITTVLVYWQIGSHEFINFDDQLYVSDNPMVKAGISWEGIKWAFSFTGRSYWHPVTWLSHMLDCELFGTDPGMHHLMNMALHLVNSLLLYAALRIMTGSHGSSSFAALLFALHPVNVDSVAWLAERKNLLSATFSILTILSHIYYSRKPGITRYLMTLCVYLLGILAKPPTLVALPFVLLLLDYWPLRRITLDFRLKDIFSQLKAKEYQKLIFRLILEKIPLLIMSVAIVFISLKSSRQNVDVITPEMVGYSLRIENALISYVLYIGKMFWPANLTIYYPYPQSLPPANAVLAGIVLLGITAASLLFIRNKPYLFTGWFWYLGTLVPVSGLLQVGLWPAMAERWVYVPAIGLFIIIGWLIPDLLSGLKQAKAVLYSLAVPVLVICAILSWKQAAYWKNDLTLFTHAVKVNDRNSVAYCCLGDYFTGKGDLVSAIANYNAAMEINPGDPTSNYNLGIVLIQTGRFDEAVGHLMKAVQKFSGDEQLYIGLGIAFTHQQKFNEARINFAKAVEINPANADTHFQLAMILEKTGRAGEAIKQYQEVLRLNPGDVKARENIQILRHQGQGMDDAVSLLEKKIEESPQDPIPYYRLGRKYLEQNKVDDAISQMKRALAIRPHFAAALNDIAVAYGRKGEYDSSLSYLKKHLEIQPDNPDNYYNIACVYARKNMPDESVAWLKKAMQKGFKKVELIKTDPDLESIRNTEFVKKLMISADPSGTTN